MTNKLTERVNSAIEWGLGPVPNFSRLTVVALLWPPHHFNLIISNKEIANCLGDADDGVRRLLDKKYCALSQKSVIPARRQRQEVRQYPT